jgi:hypothetical protein
MAIINLGELESSSRAKTFALGAHYIWIADLALEPSA